MAEADIDISGLQETQRALFQFSEKLGDRITLMALRSGANLMLKRVRLAAPKRTGRLRRAIVVKTSKIHRRRKNGKVGVYIGIKKGESRRDPKGAYYGRFVEAGYTREGQQYQGQFFIKNTFNITKNSSLRLIVRNIEVAGARLADRL